MRVAHELTTLYLQHGPYVLVHENSATGVDAAAHHWCETAGDDLGIFEVCRSADYKLHGKEARTRKGAELIKAGADLVVAFPLFDDQETARLLELAEEAGIPVRRVYA